MDISDAILKIQQEISLYKEPPSEIVSLQFQNHLYGCCTILELISEGEEDVSAGIESFSMIGCEYGFLHDERTEYTGWSNMYCDTWKSIWTKCADISSGLVDVIEGAILATLPDTFRFFKGALDTGELSDELSTECNTLFETAKRVHRRRGTEFTRRARGRRAITPISRRQPEKGRVRTFHLTRRRIKRD
jgi:hypothetical protein